MADNPISVEDEIRISELRAKYDGVDLKMPNFHENVPVIYGVGQDGRVTVGEPEGYKEQALGGLTEKFMFGMTPFKEPVVNTYTKAEFDQAFKGWDKDPEDLKVVTREEYQQALDGIEVSLYRTDNFSIKDCASGMKLRDRYMDEKFEAYEKDLAGKSEALNQIVGHQIDSVLGDAGEIIRERNDLVESGMDLKVDRITLNDVKPEDVVILVSGSIENGGYVHLSDPEEGRVGKFDDAFVYRSAEQLEELSDKIITPEQMIYDQATNTDMSTADHDIVQMRINEMCTDWIALQHKLPDEQALVNSQMGALSNVAQAEGPSAEVELIKP